MNALLDALALPFFGLLLAHFRRVLGAAGNRARAGLRHWMAVVSLVTRFALGAALKPALGIFVAMFVAIATVGVLSTRIAGIETPEIWQDVIAFTVVAVVMISAVLFVYIWDNRTLPTREIERVEVTLRTNLPGTPAHDAAVTQITARLNRDFGGRAPVAFFLIFAGGSFLLLGFELIMLSAWVFRWENDLSWTSSVWTAFVGSISMYVGGRSLKAPFTLAGVVAIEADKPLDWGLRLLADSGLLILPGFTGDNIAGRSTALNVPLERVGATLLTFGDGVLSALRYFIAVTLVALNILWMAGAAIIGFIAGLALAEQSEIARFDIHPQVQKTTWRFWGERGIFVVGIVARVLWMLVSTPAHAATAPTGPGTTAVEDVAVVAHTVTTASVPAISSSSGWWYAATHLPFGWSLVVLGLAFIPVLCLIDVIMAPKASSRGKVAVWVAAGIPTTFMLAGVVASWISAIYSHAH